MRNGNPGFKKNKLHFIICFSETPDLKKQLNFIICFSEYRPEQTFECVVNIVNL